MLTLDAVMDRLTTRITELDSSEWQLATGETAWHEADTVWGPDEDALPDAHLSFMVTAESCVPFIEHAGIVDHIAEWQARIALSFQWQLVAVEQMRSFRRSARAAAQLRGAVVDYRAWGGDSISDVAIIEAFQPLIDPANLILQVNQVYDIRFTGRTER